MNQVVALFSIVTGILVLTVGFGFHWIGQLISLTNRELAIRIGIWEKDLRPEYEVYENAIMVADVAIGWIYGIAGIGLILGTTWGFRLAWIPGVVMVYHSLGFWFWTRNQMKAGDQTTTTRQPIRSVWFAANFTTGIFAIILAWTMG